MQSLEQHKRQGQHGTFGALITIYYPFMDTSAFTTIEKAVFKGTMASPPEKDWVITEEPLLIRISAPNGTFPISVTMRSPGDDIHLALGFLLTEGIITGTEQILSYRPEQTQSGHDCMTIVMEEEYDPSGVHPERNFFVSSSCGLCGHASIDAVLKKAVWPVFATSPMVHVQMLYDLPGILRASQRAFEKTGGVHAAGLFSQSGHLIYSAEDVGRHNAVDKVIGFALRGGLVPLHDHILVVSGRAGFELVQKASMAALPIMCAVGAPSSLAVQCAQECGITLCGFMKESSMNVYSGGHRLWEGNERVRW